MRIVAGAHKGRRIAVAKGDVSRPTTDRNREALFNILAARDPELFEGARVIDLFAGSGALGLEALSRGAVFVLFVETDPGARGAIRDNIEALGVFGATRIHRRSATNLGALPASAGGPFDLAFLDPPYGKGLAEPTLDGLAEGGWLAPGAVIVVEQGKAESPAKAPGAEELARRVYGETQIGVWRAIAPGFDRGAAMKAPPA